MQNRRIERTVERGWGGGVLVAIVGASVDRLRALPRWYARVRTRWRLVRELERLYG